MVNSIQVGEDLADELSIEVEFVKVRVTAKLVYRTPAKQILAKFMQYLMCMNVAIIPRRKGTRRAIYYRKYADFTQIFARKLITAQYRRRGGSRGVRTNPPWL